MTRDKRIVELFNMMKKGRTYRPHELAKFDVSEAHINIDLNLLDDLGLVERRLDRGLIYWARK
jgi:DeoR/GlpR family transcriptional regulator of sugar metabolism